jgi:hypothetical protein
MEVKSETKATQAAIINKIIQSNTNFINKNIVGNKNESKFELENTGMIVAKYTATGCTINR